MCLVKSRVPEQKENLRVWSASMRSGLMRLQQGAHVSLLKENSCSQATADACAGRISITSQKRYGNLFLALYMNNWEMHIKARKYTYCPVPERIKPLMLDSSDPAVSHHWLMQIGVQLKAKSIKNHIISTGTSIQCICGLGRWQCLHCMVQKIDCTGRDWLQMVYRSCSICIEVLLLNFQVCCLECKHLWLVWT